MKEAVLTCATNAHGTQCALTTHGQLIVLVCIIVILWTIILVGYAVTSHTSHK
jgi:hypothetical protein